jgi:hypothetical protein
MRLRTMLRRFFGAGAFGKKARKKGPAPSPLSPDCVRQVSEDSRTFARVLRERRECVRAAGRSPA